MAKKAIAQIEIDGGASAIFPYRQVYISQRLFGHHEFEVHVPIQALEGTAGNILNKSKELIGKAIKISINSEQFLDASTHEFNGLVTHLGFSRDHGSDSDIILKGKSPTLLLDEGLHCRSFTEMSLADIVNSVLGEYPSNLLPFQVDPIFGEIIPFTVQYQESNFHFLARLAERYGEWFYFNGMELLFGRPPEEEAIPLQLGKDLHSFDLGMQMIPVNYNFHSYQYSTNEVLESAAADASVSTLDSTYGKLVFEESESLFSATPLTQAIYNFENQAELDAFMKSKRSQHASQMVVLNGSSENMSLGMGKHTEIFGNKSENKLEGLENYGEFNIIRITHRVDGNGNYQNVFEAIPAEASIPPSNPGVSIPHVQVQPAKVVENHDPDALGRVKVQLYWQKGGETTPWIRALSTAGGASGGYFVIPEIEDEVLVGFEYNHPDRPFIMGSVYHGKAKPGDSWQDGDNNIKAIKTKSGNEIILLDEGGNETIKILNKGGENSITLTMGDGGAINIVSKNKISISCKEMSINAEDKIDISTKEMNINASDSFKLTTTTADFQPSQTAYFNTEAFTVEASNSATLKGGQSILLDTSAGTLTEKGKDVNIEGLVGVNVQGTKIDVQAKATFAAKANGTASLEAAGPTTIKGAMIQLN
ncbi:MAG: contractile injection system protein, VgrG/Pvc8 family [Bacteroidota bacterium]